MVLDGGYQRSAPTPKQRRKRRYRRGITDHSLGLEKENIEIVKTS
jgi:hypothetical protein